MRHIATTLLALAVTWAPTHAQARRDLVISRAETRPLRVAPAANFTGTGRVQRLFDTTGTTRAYGASVSFEAGARTAWHTHARGQVLIGRSTDWMEKVSDAQYGARPNDPGGAGVAPARPSRAQQLMGDIAPKLGQLTDSVLFGDVWERPGLSRRDRSLVTVSALVAMNRPDQLRSHLALARENGVTHDELIEGSPTSRSMPAGPAPCQRSAWRGRCFRSDDARDRDNAA